MKSPANNFMRCAKIKIRNDGERLTQRQKEGQRRVFYDFTCSAPKSVSVLAVTLDDERLVSAHEEATRIAFRELETFAATRVRKQGSQRDRTTGNLVAAAFTHTSSRALDPQLHTHFTVFNATFDETESAGRHCKRAACMTRFVTARRFIGMNWRKRVQQIGYRIQPAKHGFEIEGVSDAVLKRFSKRAQQRDAVVQEMEQKLGRKLSNNAISLRCIRAGRKRSKASRPPKCANGSWRNCQPMNGNRCKNSARRLVQPVRHPPLNRKTKP
jgi:conjugative relaxase-like TrwC/TraI family protein